MWRSSDLVSLLTGPEKNICVVGDDDQSIYRFRGATIENILAISSAFTRAPRPSVWNKTTALRPIS